MKELWELAEELTRKIFKLQPVSGSGRGPFGKGDNKDENWQVDTKSTSKGSFALNFKDFRRYRLQAAKERKGFYMHIVPIENGKICDDRYVAIGERDFLSLLENQKEG